MHINTIQIIILTNTRVSLTKVPDETEHTTRVIQTLQPKSTYSAELQKQGWHEIMDTFRAYAETA